MGASPPHESDGIGDLDGFDELDDLDDLEHNVEHVDSPAGPAPIVAIVGRPNVGKSTLFNRLTRSRQAIVEDRPGVTRDRLYGVAHWDDLSYVVVDTGGLEAEGETDLTRSIRVQAEVAVQEADLILFVVDAVAGPTAADAEIGAYLRRSGKALMVVANKVDNPGREVEAHAASELGLGDVYAVSAAHGRGVSELCEGIAEALPRMSGESPELVPPGTRLAFIGRPNAGKSTLINALLAEPRVIVSEEAGTTRDPIYLPFKWKKRDLVLIDTAGLRRRKQIAKAMEKIAAIRSVRTIERTQVCVLVVDATMGVTDQDQRIARLAFERGKGVVVAVHKWDLIAGDAKATQAVMHQIEHDLGFLERPHVVKTSVVGPGRDHGEGKAVGLDKLLAGCIRTFGALTRRIPTGELNTELQAAVLEHNPPMHKSRPVKLYFATQAESDPPLVVISANRGRCLAPAYERYLLRRIRKRWDLRGVPIRIVVRARDRGNKERAQAGARVRERGRSVRDALGRRGSGRLRDRSRRGSS